MIFIVVILSLAYIDSAINNIFRILPLKFAIFFSLYTIIKFFSYFSITLRVCVGVFAFFSFLLWKEGDFLLERGSTNKSGQMHKQPRGEFLSWTFVEFTDKRKEVAFLSLSHLISLRRALCVCFNLLDMSLYGTFW